MRKVQFKESNAINKRANAKAVTIDGRHYLIGGLSPAGTECDIVEMKLVRESPDKLLVDWKPLKITHLEKVFSERNSFAACALGNKIYIYGGISMKEQGPCTLGDLLEIDVQKQTARTIEQKGEKPPALNSATLVSCSKEAKLVLFGGANDELQAALHLYFFDIQHETWTKRNIELPIYQSGIWQHTCHYSEELLRPVQGLPPSPSKNSHAQKIVGLDLGVGSNTPNEQLTESIKKVTIGEEPFDEVVKEPESTESHKVQTEQIPCPPGPYLVVVGGCSNPNEPYPYVCCISLPTGQIASQISLNPMVAHESNLYNGQLYIMGGSDGNILVSELIILGKTVQREKGVAGLGSVSFATDMGLVFYGGINAESHSFNGFALIDDAVK